MLIYLLQSDPQIYFMIVITIIASIVLHELAHGIVAIRLGDRTPIETGHMTLSPIVHLGIPSLIMLCVVGMAWGSMPVRPDRLRGRYGDALVSVAGPATNFLIAIVLASVYALLLRYQDEDSSKTFLNAMTFLQIASVFNLINAAFNLIPVPPLDGSRILGNIHQPYGQWVADHPQMSMPMLLGLIILISSLGNTPYNPFAMATRAFVRYVALWQ